MSTTQKVDLDWKNLAFEYLKADFNIRFTHENGVWSGGELVSDEYVSLHMAAPSLHYGQQAFEGMKAFRTADGRIVVFRPEENAKRLKKSCERISMPTVDEAMFLDAIQRVVAANAHFVPPYGTGASLYIRPLIFGDGGKIGLGPAEQYHFIVMVTPVGPYYKGGFNPVKALIVEEYDRAAPHGVGDCKVGGNYAAGLAGGQFGKDKGFPVVLYLDSAEKKYIDEFSTSNFIGIKGNTFISPASRSILPSITNDSLGVIASDMGMKVERRPVPVEELKEFDEIGAVGTAAVITPVSHIQYRDEELIFGDGVNAGKKITELYKALVDIQTGEVEDTHNWLKVIKI